jgi:hypothetical protein
MASPKKQQSVILPWLNEGKETKLGPIPVKGDLRLELLRTEGADIVAQDFRSFTCYMRGSLLAVKDTIRDQGATDAHKQWMIAFGEYENLRWDEDAFEASVDNAIRDYVLTPLKATDAKEAVKLLEEEAKSLNRHDTADFKKRRREWQRDLHMEEVFWCLWRADPHPAFMPDPNKVPSEADIQAAKGHIAFFLDDVSYAAIITAQRGASPIKANLEALQSPMTEEMVRGKASVTSKH